MKRRSPLIKMETKYIHVSSGKGPAECCLAVSFASREIIAEAKRSRMLSEIVSKTNGEMAGTFSSIVIKMQGRYISHFIEQWCGMWKWIAQSPYRKFHKRKNWFIGIQLLDLTEMKEWNEKDLYYQAIRASGPGGQHVNKVASAIRAVHTPTGLQVKVNNSRSQMKNKKEAAIRLKEQFENMHQSVIQKKEEDQWEYHQSFRSADPVRIYSGMNFKREK